MSREYKYKGPNTVDVTSTGAVTELELEKKNTVRTALRVDAGGDSPQVALEASPDGNTWYQLEQQTGSDFDILRNVPERYVRPNVTTTDNTDTGTAEMTIVSSPK